MKSCDSKQTRLYDSIILIHIKRSDSLDACTCGGLYYSAEPLPMGFTLPHTRLAFKHLKSLSCQRLGPSATLTTWISLFYVRLTDSLEFWVQSLLESLSNYIHYTPPWNLTKSFIELRLSHTTTMLLVPNHIVSHTLLYHTKAHPTNQNPYFIHAKPNM